MHVIRFIYFSIILFILIVLHYWFIVNTLLKIQIEVYLKINSISLKQFHASLFLRSKNKDLYS